MFKLYFSFQILLLTEAMTHSYFCLKCIFSDNQAEQIELGISSGSSSSVELQTVNDQLGDGQTVIYNQEYIYPGNNDS